MLTDTSHTTTTQFSLQDNHSKQQEQQQPETTTTTRATDTTTHKDGSQEAMRGRGSNSWGERDRVRESHTHHSYHQGPTPQQVETGRKVLHVEAHEKGYHLSRGWCLGEVRDGSASLCNTESDRERERVRESSKERVRAAKRERSTTDWQQACTKNTYRSPPKHMTTRTRKRRTTMTTRGNTLKRTKDKEK